jgi:hypothetical protein
MDEEQLKKYAVKYLDNGGKYEDIPSKNNRIKNAVKSEEIRRYKVYIRKAMLQNTKYSKEILNIIKQNKEILNAPSDLYDSLDKLGFEKLKNLKKKALQHSK